MSRIPAMFLLLALGACSSSGTSNKVSATTDAGMQDGAVGARALKLGLAFNPDADGAHVTFGTQNGSTVQLLKSDLTGKSVYWITTHVGEPAANALPIDVSVTTIGADLTTSYVTPSHYADGAYEVSVVVAVTGSMPPNLPAAGDLAAFDNSPPPAGEPAPTGASVRVHVKGADASLALSNASFIRFGK